MIETSPLRKNKISLADYNFRKDIENRLLMAHFTTLDLEVLEEILYSPITISIKKLLKNLDVEEEDLASVLKKFSAAGLFSIAADTLTVDKEVRKYYESQVSKFDEDFTPGMEFLQGLLRKVPIHVLPSWYSIPRTSNNIFESLVEKYLLTPQIFQRYLAELHFTDPALSGIVKEVYSSAELKVPASMLLDKLSLSREQFEEYMLQLEFHFVCCLGYSKTKDFWEEVVTPFHEWREYALFLKNTQTSPLPKEAKILRTRDENFAWIEDLEALLLLAKKQPLAIQKASEGKCTLAKSAISSKFETQRAIHEKSLPLLLSKACMLRFAEIKENKFCTLDSAEEWLALSLENKALYLYRHPLNSLQADHLPQHFFSERVLREAEKSIFRVLHTGWVYFDEFLKGVIVPLNDDSPVMLKKLGKTWKYYLPEYTDEEKTLFREIIFQWLFEMGVVATGSCSGKECFCVTPFGQSLFGR